MPASALGPPNPFAAELRRAAAGAAAPDRAPSLRELSTISGVGRSAIGDWLAGKSLPRSWDDGAVLVVDAIIKLAARYGKRFPDEEAVRQRCRDAYYIAKNAQQENGTPSGCAPVQNVAGPAAAMEAVSHINSDDGSGEGPVGSVPASGTAASLMGRWRTKRAVSVVVFLAVVAITITLTMLWPAERSRATLPTNPSSLPIPSGPTPLQASHSKKCVTAEGDAEESRAFQSGCKNAPGGTWYLRPVEGAGDLEYLFRIVNASNSKCLSYSDGLVGGAHIVVQRSCANDQGQMWSFTPNPDRGDRWIYGRFTNMRSSRCLDINNEGVDDGTPVVQWNCGEKLNQLFKIMKEPVG